MRMAHADRPMRRNPYWPAWIVTLPSRSLTRLPLDRTHSRGHRSGPAVAVAGPLRISAAKRRSPPDTGRRSVDEAMSPAGRVTGSRPINHGCSTRDRRSGSPLQPFATVVRSMVRGRRPECPRLCRVTAHPNHAPCLGGLGMAGMSRSQGSMVGGVRAPVPGRTYRVAGSSHRQPRGDPQMTGG
jgi:hypothetical protein